MSDSQGQGTGEQPSGQVPQDSLASGFLEKIPEADRNVVGQYVKEWDAGVTRKFQEIHDGYRGYKDLGTVEDIKVWREVADLLENNPQHVYNVLAEQLGVQQQQPAPQTPSSGGQGASGTSPQVPPVAVPGQQPQQFQGLPPELDQRLTQNEQLVAQLAKTFIDNHKATQAAQEDQELDSYLGNLKQSHGDFDEEWVLLQMYKGVDGEKAVQQYQELVGQSSRPQVPPPLSGGGVIGQQQSVKDMGRDEVRNLVAGIIGSVNKE